MYNRKNYNKNVHTELCKSEGSFISKHKVLLLFTIIYLILSFFLFDPKLFVGGDNAVYIILAESITSGKGYRNLHLPDESPHTQYPFGFPLLLSLPILLFGTNIIILKLFVVLTSIGALFFMYRLCELFFREKVDFIMAFYISIPILITFNHWILSEMPFLCFSLAALYFFMKAKQDKEYLYFISIFLATYAFLIRMVGISLIAAMMLSLALRKQYKYFIIFLLIFLTVLIPWLIRSVSIGPEGGYIDQLLTKKPYLIESGKVGPRDLAIRGWNNFIFYSLLLLPLTLLTSILSPWILGVMGVMFIVLTIIGFVERRRRMFVVEYYFLFAVLLLLVWPEVWATERFLLPILPIIIIYIYIGLFQLERKIKFKYSVHLITGIFVFINLLSIFPQVKNAVVNNNAYLRGDMYAGYRRDWRNYFDVIEWIKENVPEEKIIMARKPEFVYLLSRHRSLTCPFSIDENNVRSAFMQSDYIILDNFMWTEASKNYLAPVIQKEFGNIEFVYITQKPRFYVVRVKK